MKLHQLKYFLAVCHTKNFTRAAGQCNVSQPALTRAIGDLEHEVGGRLFLRGHVHTDLTPLGQFLRGHLEAVDDRLRQIRIAVRCWRNLETPLRIGMLDSIGASALFDCVAGFAVRHPRIDIEIQQASGPLLADRVAAATLDLAFITQPRHGDGRLGWHRLYHEPFVVAFGAGHRFAAQAALRLPDLAGETYVDRLCCDRRQEVDGELCRRGIDIKAAYRSDSDQWVLRAVAAGLGIAIMPRSLAAAPGLESRPLVDPAVSRVIGVVAPEKDQMSPAAQAFLKQASIYGWSISRH